MSQVVIAVTSLSTVTANFWCNWTRDLATRPPSSPHVHGMRLTYQFPYNERTTALNANMGTKPCCKRHRRSAGA